MDRAPKVPVAPKPGHDLVRGRGARRGRRVVDRRGAATGLVWTAPADPDGLSALLREHPQSTGCSCRGPASSRTSRSSTATSVGPRAKGVYADPVAEHALALLLAGLRDLVRYARADRWAAQVGTTWSAPG